MRCLTAACCALLLSVATPTRAAEPQAGPAALPAAPAPDIAPPSPRASPQAVEESKETAGAAELTPILPSPKDPLRPAFQLYAEIDLPVLAIGLVFASGRLVRAQPAYCAPLCDPAGLNSLDRATAGYWDTGWQKTSDYALLAIGAGAASLLILDEGLLPGLNDLVVVSEAALAGVAITSMMTMAAGRPRPFLYGEKAPLDARSSADAGLSFLSSHSVAAFAVVTSTFVAMRRLHPGQKHAWVVLGVGGALATLVASARVMGGKHFITDSAGGAVVGASMGFLVSSLHGSPVAIVPVVGARERGLAFNLRF